jgi:hypothetical protein
MKYVIVTGDPAYIEFISAISPFKPILIRTVKA